MWYEQERYFMASELGLVCVTAEYTLMSEQDNIKVNNTGIQRSVCTANCKLYVHPYTGAIGNSPL